MRNVRLRISLSNLDVYWKDIKLILIYDFKGLKSVSDMREIDRSKFYFDEIMSKAMFNNDIVNHSTGSFSFWFRVIKWFIKENIISQNYKQHFY